MSRLNLIVARADNGTIGRDGTLPWHLPDDLKHFRALTMGHTIVMGRRTYESIGRPLPGRRNVIVSNTPGFAPAGCTVVASLADARALAGDDAVFVIGGARLYAEALPLADRIHLTEVHASVAGDVAFPELAAADWRESERIERGADDRHAYPYAFVVLERVR